MDAMGFETLSPGATAVGFTLATISPSDSFPALKAVVTVDAGQVRIRWDGTSPTASVGHLYTQGSTITLVGMVNLRAFRAISADGKTATLSCTYESGALGEL